MLYTILCLNVYFLFVCQNQPLHFYIEAKGGLSHAYSQEGCLKIPPCLIQMLRVVYFYMFSIWGLKSLNIAKTTITLILLISLSFNKSFIAISEPIPGKNFRPIKWFLRILLLLWPCTHTFTRWRQYMRSRISYFIPNSYILT